MYYTEQAARKAASAAAKRAGSWRYVVAEGYGPDRIYDSASDYDLESFWQGAEVLAAYGPDGTPDPDYL